MGKKEPRTHQMKATTVSSISYAPDEGDHSLLHQLLLEEGEGATPVQIPDDLKSTRICTAAMRLLASLYAIL